MVTMVDEIFDRHYQSARRSLNGTLAHGFAALGAAIGTAFDVLVRIEYQAPWSARITRPRCN